LFGLRANNNNEQSKPRKRTGKVTAATLVLFASGLSAATATALTATPAAAVTVPGAPSGWTTVFSDSFSGAAGSAPSAQNWFYDIGTGYGNNEVEQTTNSPSNIYQDGNGHLVIQANDTAGAWTSAKIESTRDDFQAPAGGELEMTASIQQPNPAGPLGYWPAFWALGAPLRTTGSWPQAGEIDLLEDINGHNLASQNLHYGSNGQSGPRWSACPNNGSTCQTGYHTYSVLIDRRNTRSESLQFSIDNTVTQTVTESSVGPSAWQAAVDHGFYLILNLAIGGTWPDADCGCTAPTAATTSGGSMSVGYVAVYEYKGNSTPTATARATGSLAGPGAGCLANAGSLNAEWNQVDLAACDGSAGEQWSPYSDGTLRVQGGCLTSSGGIYWYPCVGTSQQQWTRQSNGTLYNPSARLCLTAGSATAKPTSLSLARCTGATTQKWVLP
jgi:hypothetical protein